jgi:hypothetical protein
VTVWIFLNKQTHIGWRNIKNSNPNPLKINKQPIQTATYGIAFLIRFRIGIVRYELMYTTAAHQGTVPNPNRSYKTPNFHFA